VGTDHPLEGSAPRTTRGWRLLVSVAAVIVIVYGIQASQQVLVPFLLSVFLAVIGARPVAWMDQRGLPHTLSVVIFVVGVMSALILVSAIVGTSITEFSNRIPLYQESLSKALTDVAERVVGRRTPLSVEELLANVRPASAMRLTATVLNALRGVFADAFVILFMVVFILLEVSSFPVKLDAIHPRSRATIQEFAAFADSLQHYLNLKTLICLLTGLAVGVWVAVLGIDFPVLWGLLAFLLNYIPTIGSFIAAIPAVMLGFIQFGLGRALIAAAGYAVINVVIGNLLEPRVMGKGLGLSTLVVFLSLLFWGWVLGPVGMILSVPLTMTIKIALQNSSRTRWVAVLLGRGDAPSIVDASMPASSETVPDTGKA
jgi:AI-2 transport protein TqsA